jgi:hypothetical protein
LQLHLLLIYLNNIILSCANILDDGFEILFHLFNFKVS